MYNFSSAVENALYMLKFSSYIFSIVPFASSIPSSFRFSLSLSLKNPSELGTLGNTPSFTPIINIALTLWVLDLFTSPTVTLSCVCGIWPISLTCMPVFSSFAYVSNDILTSLNKSAISSITSITAL